MLLLLVIVCFGFGLIYLLPKSLHGFSKILLGPALGILLFTQIFLFLSFVVGANFISIAIATIMLFIISVVVLWKQRSRLPIGKSDFLPYIVIAIVTALLGWIWLVQTLSFHNGMFFTGGGGMYGDTALHAAYTSRLQAGEFPPQNPLYAGKILVYPFANDLFSSSLLTNGLDFNLAFALPQILFLLAFLVLFYETCLKFTNKKGFIVSLIILLLGWGIGGFIFLGSWLSRLNDFWGVLNTDVTNNPDLHLQLHNILTGLILPERSFLPGLVLGLLFFLNFWEYTTHKSLKYLAINGIILGALPFWHTHTFIYYSIFSLVVGTWLYYKEASKKTLFHLFLMFGLAFLLSLPFLWLFFY
ncbi:hypothetical protein HY024_04950 [Candidatus Curtissbacteria bacterium]|nr:hypothetical protein [Candidatus Curtissbacteria bacterium]